MQYGRLQNHVTSSPPTKWCFLLVGFECLLLKCKTIVLGNNYDFIYQILQKYKRIQWNRTANHMNLTLPLALFHHIKAVSLRGGAWKLRTGKAMNKEVHNFAQWSNCDSNSRSYQFQAFLLKLMKKNCQGRTRSWATWYLL